MTATERTYRFAPPDRTGLVLGLGTAQVVAVGTALATGAVALNRGAPPVLVLAVVAAGLAAGFVRIGGQPLLEALPAPVGHAWRALRGRNAWFAPLPLLGDADADPPLPPAMEGQVTYEVEPAAFGSAGFARPVGVVHDRRTGTHAATLRASGRRFALVERAEQDRLVAVWGDALAGACREQSPVAWVRWAEWTAPAGMEEQLAYLVEHGAPNADAGALASYGELLAAAGPLSTRHEVLVTAAVAERRLRGGAAEASSRRGDRRAAATAALLEELRLLTGRLEAAELAVSAPLTRAELARATRERLDPAAAGPLDRRGRSLGELAGVVRPLHAGPLSADNARTAWHVDGTVHRTFYVREWPRLEVAADWMGRLLLPGGAVRTVAVYCEPVAPRRSSLDVERQATKLESDAEQRRRSGFRVNGAHRRQARAVEEREEELVAGHGEHRFAAVVAVAAADAEALREACRAVAETAAGAGMDLTPLHGRHDRGTVAALPLARGLS